MYIVLEKIDCNTNRSMISESMFTCKNLKTIARDTILIGFQLSYAAVIYVLNFGFNGACAVLQHWRRWKSGSTRYIWRSTLTRSRETTSPTSTSCGESGRWSWPRYESAACFARYLTEERVWWVVWVCRRVGFMKRVFCAVFFFQF